MIKQITFEEILPIWTNHLWPNRTSPIEPHSAMLFKEKYDMQNYKYPASFFAYYINDNIIGVNSGHRTFDDGYRSRGLYVMPEYRKKGIAKKLLLHTIEQGKIEGAQFIWSYPRQPSWKSYESAGFELASDWRDDETGVNAYCILRI